MSVRVSDEYVKRLECFVYHKDLSREIIESMERVRQGYVDLAELVCKLCPESRSKSLSLTYLEDSLMRSIQSLALTGVMDREV